MKEDIWAIIPAHNEAKRIAAVIEKTKKILNNVVVVDDGSTDNTYDIAVLKNIVVLRHIVNMHKGAALKTGCDYALSKGAKIIVVLDADGQHDPDEIPNFIKTIEKENCDIVFGYRKRTKEMPFLLRFGNWFLNQIARFFYGIKMQDTQSGYRCFTAEAYRKIRWSSLGYEMESEMIANVGKHKLKYKEIPIATIYSEKYKGTTILDGIKIAFRMLFWKLTK